MPAINFIKHHDSSTYKTLISYANTFGGDDVVFKCISKLFNISQPIEEWEHIIDYLIHKKFSNLDWSSYDLLLSKANKWSKQLSRNVAIIDEEEGVDINTVLDFEDGYRFVELLSEKAYQREGACMRHCVASYFGRNVKIYSLRDAFNKPHCTIEKDNQIKGKGNNSVVCKYINYVVRFLEWSGMEVREYEMENLGYVKVKFIDYLANDNLLFRGEYVYKDDVDKLKYKDGYIVFDSYYKYKTSNYFSFGNYNKTVLLADGVYGGMGRPINKNFKVGEGLENFIENAYIYMPRKALSCYHEFDFYTEKIGAVSEINDDVELINSEFIGFDNLKRIRGDLYLSHCSVADFGLLERVDGNVYIMESTIGSFENLKSIGGKLCIVNSVINSFGALELIGGKLIIKGKYEVNFYLSYGNRMSRMYHQLSDSFSNSKISSINGNDVTSKNISDNVYHINEPYFLRRRFGVASTTSLHFDGFA